MTRLGRAGLLAGVAGPAAFVGAWVLGGLQRPGYDPVSQAISQLARSGTSTQPLMTTGFVAFGLLLPAYALALRDRVGTAPAVAAAVSGLATLAVAASPLSAAGAQPVDVRHAVAAGTGYAAQVLAPLLAARRLPAAPLSYAVSGTALAALLGSVLLPDLTGLLQRTGLTVVDAWYAVVAGHLLRTRVRG